MDQYAACIVACILDSYGLRVSERQIIIFWILGNKNYRENVQVWDMTPCRLVNSYRDFVASIFIEFKWPQELDHEDGGIKLVGNVGNYLPINMASWSLRTGIFIKSRCENQRCRKL
jgi:hypothetical protein